VGVGPTNWWDGELATRGSASSDARPLIDDVDPGDQPIVPPVTVGGWLRAERERQGLGLDAVEAVTRIRVGQLRAIEENRFDALPGDTYARAFVRSYAEHLGLDATTAAVMFDDQRTPPQPAAGDLHSLPAYPPVAATRRQRDRWAWAAAALTAVALIASAALFLFARQSATEHSAARPPETHATGAAQTTPPTSRGTTTGGVAGRASNTTAVVIRATSGPCWVEAHAWRETGPLLVMKTLEPGDVLRLRRPRIWLRLGDPSTARVVVNGRQAALPETPTPVNVMVTRHGASVA
jgi:cytoskeleton protein RodZ